MRRRRHFRHNFVSNRRRFDGRRRRLGWRDRNDSCHRLDFHLRVRGGFGFGRRDSCSGGLHCLDEARRRQHGRRGFRRLGRFLGCGRWLLALDDRSLSEDIARRQLDVALLGQTIDELTGDDFFDRARGALHLDAMIALEKRRHFLARRPEQLRDLVNPDC
jgi:hypothetical protein